MIIAIALIYLLCGFIFNLVITLFHDRLNDDTILWLICDFNDNMALFMNVIMWPFFLLGSILVDLIPYIIKKLYILFVTIIFLIVALFKKEEENDSKAD